MTSGAVARIETLEAVGRFKLLQHLAVMTDQQQRRAVFPCSHHANQSQRLRGILVVEIARRFVVASTSLGRLASARATAARCCCPVESCRG